MRANPPILDKFLAPVVAGIAGSWSSHRFDWWCRVCEPWPPERIEAGASKEPIFWLDFRGLPRGVWHMHDFETGEWLGTVDWREEPSHA